MSYPTILAGGWASIADEIDEEIMRADKLFGRDQEGLILIAAMTEELGETARAFLHEHIENKPVKMSSRKEAIQLAGLVVRFIRDWR